MEPRILITVRFSEGRYHGTGDWPPSPARLFQAIVAGVGLSGPIGKDELEALTWLEGLPPPVVAAPTMHTGQRVMFYMPNNDLDSVGGDPRRIAEVRSAKKYVRPCLFDSAIPFMYAWSLQHGFDNADLSDKARRVCRLAENLYQLGRGIDIAHAVGEVVHDATLESRLHDYPGRIYRPTPGGSGQCLACPGHGSLGSLQARHAASGARFTSERVGKTAKQLFTQPPKPRFVQVAHDSPSARYAFDIRDRADQAAFSVWPIALASKLVELVRDATVVKLVKALPLQQAKIERALIGRKPDGTNEGPPSARVRIIPLPSIGHHHADHNIRRILVEVPSSCPLRHDDVHWALSGLDIIDQETGEVYDGILTPGADETMQHHYGIGESTGSHIWRSQTPVALPDAAKRRRIEPTRKDSEAKDGHERIVEQSRAAAALVQALRQAGIRGNANAIRVQREPFDARGQRVESFAAGTRFCKERLWHVEIRFEAPIAGPMTVGDGRFLGLGVMAPVRELGEVHAFSIKSGLNDEAEPVEITGALRRAVMARVQQQLGARNLLPAFFTGHDIDGTPARREQHEHLTFTFDPAVKRLLVIAPHMLARRQPTRDETSNLDTLKRALVDFTELRAGSAGRLALRSCTIDVNDDPLFEPARTWETLTAYQVTRHRKDKGATAAFVEDVLSECQRCGLPEPQVTPHETRGVRGVGLTGRARLTFAVAVAGPIVLGRSRHFGGGLFIAASI